MKNKRTNFMLVIALLFSLMVHPAIAQTKRIITLQQAIELGVKNSGQLKLNQAKIMEASAAVKEALDRRLPDASVTASHVRLTHPTVDLKVKSSGSGTASPSPSVSSASYAMANVSMPLYAGGRIKYGIESAKYLEEAARLDSEFEHDAVVMNIINAYDNLYKAQSAVQVVKENLESNRQRVKDFSNLEKNGVLARNDLLKSELQTSNIELSLLDAENNARLANYNMTLLLGIPDATEIATDITSLKTTSELKPLEDYVQLGLQKRKDVEALSIRKKAAAVGIKAAKAELYPSIAANGGYVAANIPNLVTITNAVNIGVGVQYNIASLWKNSAKVEQAKARQTQMEASEGMLQDAVRLQVNQAYQNYLLSLKKIEVLQKAVTQSEENYKIIRNKYTNTLATATELLDADVAQLQSKLNYAFATSDATVAYSKLLLQSGQLAAAK
jgi:outer membrane protein